MLREKIEKVSWKYERTINDFQTCIVMQNDHFELFLLFEDKQYNLKTNIYANFFLFFSRINSSLYLKF